ncbi:hypothetical protein FD754_015434 [Muntiacus muntjak]|uniref:inositol-polyphosphate 5-phosphatase n=1 Tax=Muntiacus muntjak TaxID=9888 RepID=A0A5N3VMS5_MUNMU|nr:hypothetical protein FD754_015434 [Muntiacus muntjak]
MAAAPRRTPWSSSSDRREARLGAALGPPARLLRPWILQARTLGWVVHAHRPHFLALHCQEFGGKNYEASMSHVDKFVKTEVTLGLLPAKKYKKVTGKEIYSDTLESTPMLEKEKFPQDYFPEVRPGWARQGGLGEGWRTLGWDGRGPPRGPSSSSPRPERPICPRSAFDLVNIHLFHDASNLVAWETSPSVYSGIRHKALGYVLDRIIDQRFEKASYFVFGDFNFRLDSKSVVETLCTKATMQTVRAADTNEVVKLIFRESDNDRKVMLQLEKKLFDYFNQEVFRDDNGTALLEFDKELSVFKDRLYELDISFPPSYPYSEDCSQGRQYMNTRCPAWCDRVLMSPSAKELILRVSEAGGPAGGGRGGGRPGGSLLPPVVLGLGCSPGSGVKTA